MAEETLAQLPSFSKSPISKGVLTIHGFGARLRMQSGHLEIEDGLGPERSGASVSTEWRSSASCLCRCCAAPFTLRPSTSLCAYGSIEDKVRIGNLSTEEWMSG